MATYAVPHPLLDPIVKLISGRCAAICIAADNLSLTLTEGVW
jgi:hypothetical protein